MMRTIMPTASHEASSSQKRNFKWIIRGGRCKDDHQEKDNRSSSTSTFHSPPEETASVARRRRRPSAAAAAVSRFRSVVTAALLASRHNRSDRFGSRMTGTLYGHRRGHVQLAFQVESSKSSPMLLLELATPTSNLVREMGSGLVRIALECERKEPKKLLEEAIWRAYCNGRKCGYAVRRECGPADWKVLKAVEPVSMGAGVLPDGETMYMRARFERVVGSRDSEAFYMMNPDGNGGGTELSIYFLRI